MAGPLGGGGAGDLRVPMSYPIFMPKLSTHRMYAHDQLFHTYGQKVLTYNQISQIKYNCYIDNVSKD
jgi:hypothetical protein